MTMKKIKINEKHTTIFHNNNVIELLLIVYQSFIYRMILASWTMIIFYSIEFYTIRIW